MRQEIGSILCDGCRRLIGVNETSCPYCGRRYPALWGYGPALRRWFGSASDLSRPIILACATLYVISLLIDIKGIRTGNLTNLLSPSSFALYTLGMTGGATWQAGFWWTVFSAVFLHGSLFHIGMNMLILSRLGPMVQEAFGAARFIVLFIGAGVIGFVISNLASGAPTIGASGSVFGLMAALVVFGRKVGQTVWSRQVLIIAAVLFFMGLRSSEINNFAHAGGFAGGWMIATLMQGGIGKESNADQMLAIGGVIATFLAVIVTVIRVLMIA